MGIVNHSMIKIEIDGIEFKAKYGSKIIEIADEVGIYIPRFCYHKKLSIAANCRMCLVEIEKAPKLFPACATPIAKGMKIFTNTDKVINAQKAIMEFLLINHPLDCPICDQGGECELQDLTVGYGCSNSRFIEKKRSVSDYDFGSLIATDITRCILCSRCVRFCKEIAGTEELGIINRGSDSKIFTFLKNHLVSEVSGNIIDLCPVGALTAKPSKFKFRPWELIQHSFISYHDCVGSNLYTHILDDKIVRIVPRKNEYINESWISDRDRFSYEGLYSEDKLKYPMIKKNGKWIDTSWNEALDYSCTKLNGIKENFGSEQMACLASTNSTVEEFFMLQKLFRSFGLNNIDHRLKQQNFMNQDKFPSFIGLDTNIDEMDNIDLAILIGSNITNEQPIIAIKLRKIINNGGKVFVINPIDFNLSINFTEKYIMNPLKILGFLASITKTVSEKVGINNNFFGMENLFKSIKKQSNHEKLTKAIIESKKKLILLGSYVSSSPDYDKIVSISILLSKICSSNLGIMTDGSNSSGAWLTGFVPHRLPGGKSIPKNNDLNTINMFEKNLRAYILFGIETKFDFINTKTAMKALHNSDFVLSFSSFKNDVLLDTSDVILPIASSYENSGTFINISGVLQSFSSVISCNYEVKQGWVAINSLASYLKIPDFLYNDTFSILKEFKKFFNKNFNISWNTFIINDISSNIDSNVILISSLSQYDIDPLTRRAKSLQKFSKKNNNIIKCNKYTYNKLKTNNDSTLLNININKKRYLVFVDNSISDNVIFIESCNVSDFYNLNLPYKPLTFDEN